MGNLYDSYAELAAAETEGVDYLRTSREVADASWVSIAIHGGGIEAGSGEMADEVAGTEMSFYEFDGIKSSGNFDLHITSTLFDEPICVGIVAASTRTLSFHGYSGTTGVAETAIGGLDTHHRDRISDALTAAGFTVVLASEEIAGTDPDNICNENASGAGVQLAMSRSLRESFFPGGNLSKASRDAPERTQAFYDYANAIRSVYPGYRTYPWTYGDVLNPGGTVYPDNRGDMPAWPIFEVTGPVSFPIITNERTGSSFLISADIPAGQTVSIDSRTGVVQPQQYRLVGRPFSLEPGVNTVRWRASNGVFDPDAELCLSWRNTWE